MFGAQGFGLDQKSFVLGDEDERGGEPHLDDRVVATSESSADVTQKEKTSQRLE